MTNNQRTSQPGWLASLTIKPKQYTYLQAMRLLTNHPSIMNVLDVIPQDTGLNLAWDIHDFFREDGRYKLTVNRPALTGNNSVLPSYINDSLRHCTYDLEQAGLNAFFQVFNTPVLMLDYEVSAACHLPLYLEKSKITKTPLPTDFLNFIGIHESHKFLWLLPYALRSQIQTKAIRGLGQIASHCLGLQTRIEHERVGRWRISSSLRWRLSPAFKLHTNTILGNCVWAESEMVRVVISVQSQSELYIVRTATSLRERLKILTKVLLPFYFVNYIIELPVGLAEPPRLSAKQNTYRLSYYCGDGSEIPEGHIWQALTI